MTTQVKDALDRANPNTIADGFRAIKLGTSLAQTPKQTQRHLDMDAQGTSEEDLATLDSLELPNDAKAMWILRAFGRAGGAGTGEMTVVAPDATPVSGEIGVSPAGNIVTLAADALTDVDIEYFVAEGVVLSLSLPVATNVLTIPAALTARGVVALLQANATTATATGRKIILTPGAGAPAAGQARLDIAKATVTFAGADAVTEATVILLVADEDGTMADILEGETPPLI